MSEPHKTISVISHTLSVKESLTGVIRRLVGRKLGVFQHVKHSCLAGVVKTEEKNFRILLP